MPSNSFFVDCRPLDSLRKTQNLEVYRGDSMVLDIVVTEDGEPRDLTGGFFWFTVKTNVNDTDGNAHIIKTLGNGIEVLNASLGQLRITVDPDDTLNIPIVEAKSFLWDLQFQDSTGTIVTIFKGRLKVKPEVTSDGGFVVGGVLPLLGVGNVAGFGIVAGVNPVQDGDNTVPQDEIQTINVDGAVAGTFTLTAEDPNNPGNFETTGLLNWNATQAEIETELELLTFIDDVSMSGAASLDLGDIDVTFDGAAITTLDFSLMTMDVSALT